MRRVAGDPLEKPRTGEEVRLHRCGPHCPTSSLSCQYVPRCSSTQVAWRQLVWSWLCTGWHGTGSGMHTAELSWWTLRRSCYLCVRDGLVQGRSGIQCGPSCGCYLGLRLASEFCFLAFRVQAHAIARCALAFANQDGRRDFISGPVLQHTLGGTFVVVVSCSTAPVHHCCQRDPAAKLCSRGNHIFPPFRFDFSGVVIIIFRSHAAYASCMQSTRAR